jgi:hypothetical protein
MDNTRFEFVSDDEPGVPLMSGYVLPAVSPCFDDGARWLRALPALGETVAFPAPGREGNRSLGETFLVRDIRHDYADDKVTVTVAREKPRARLQRE